MLFAKVFQGLGYFGLVFLLAAAVHLHQLALVVLPGLPHLLGKEVQRGLTLASKGRSEGIFFT